MTSFRCFADEGLVPTLTVFLVSLEEMYPCKS